MSDVEKIAKMQYIIDSYETSLTLLAAMCRDKKETLIPAFNTDCSPWIEVIFEFIKEHLDDAE